MDEFYTQRKGTVAYLWTAGKGHHNSLIPDFTEQDILLDTLEKDTVGVDGAVRNLLGFSYGTTLHIGALTLDGHTVMTPEQVQLLREVECIARCHVGYDSGPGSYMVFANIFLTADVRTGETLNRPIPSHQAVHLHGCIRRFMDAGVPYPREQLYSSVSVKCTDDEMTVTQSLGYPRCIRNPLAGGIELIDESKGIRPPLFSDGERCHREGLNTNSLQYTQSMQTLTYLLPEIGAHLAEKVNQKIQYKHTPKQPNRKTNK